MRLRPGAPYPHIEPGSLELRGRTRNLFAKKTVSSETRGSRDRMMRLFAETRSLRRKMICRCRIAEMEGCLKGRLSVKNPSAS